MVRRSFRFSCLATDLCPVPLHDSRRPADHRTPRLRCVVPFLLALVLSTACASLTTSSSKPSPADSLISRRRLDEGLKEYWTFALTRRTDLETAVGLRPTVLPTLSYEARREDVRVGQRIGRMLDQIESDALSQSDYLTMLSLRWELEARAEQAAFYWTDFSDISPHSTPVRQSIEIFRRQPFSATSDVERYLYFLDAFPFMLDGLRAGLEARAMRGYLAPRETVESAVAFFSALRALDQEGPWRVESLRLTTLDSVEARAFAAEARVIIKERVLPALDSLVRYLGDVYRPRASTRAGLWQYPGGKEHYRHLIRRYSSLDITPDDAHKVGLAELRRIDSTMAVLRTRFKWAKNMSAVNDSLRRVMGSAAPSMHEAIDGVLAAQARLIPQLAARFSVVPSLAPIVRQATALESLLWPDGTYLPAAFGDSTGQLLVTKRWRSPSARLAVAAASYRLLLPGTHLRAQLMSGNDTLAPFRRLHASSGFTEGWSQYAASLVGEMGMYATPLDAYGRLLDEGFAAALLVVDSGIHYLGWSSAQARTVLSRYSLENDATVDSVLVERVVNAPGRAVAATLGGREIAAMRAWVQRELGRTFDLKAWHAQLLSLGPIPLPIVGTHLEWWLYDIGRKADEARAAAAKAARAAKGAAGAPGANDSKKAGAR